MHILSVETSLDIVGIHLVYSLCLYQMKLWTDLKLPITTVATSRSSRTKAKH